MRIIDQILACGDAIEANCAHAEIMGRGLAAQNILAQVRNLIDALASLIHVNNANAELEYDYIVAAHDSLKKIAKYKFIYELYDYLQVVSSHYIVDEINSVFVLNKYCAYLIRIRDYLKDNYGIDIMSNVESVLYTPKDDLKDYYKAIKDDLSSLHSGVGAKYAYYYVMSCNPIIIEGKIFYEVELCNSKKKSNKLGNVIAFADFDLPAEYRARFSFFESSVTVNDGRMPLLIINDYKVAIPSSVINRFGKIVNFPLDVSPTMKEYQNLMTHLTREKRNLLDLVSLDDEQFGSVFTDIAYGCKKIEIFPFLCYLRDVIAVGGLASVIIKYFLITMEGKIMSAQCADDVSEKLQGFYLKNGCIPFAEMPLCTSLIGHNPTMECVLKCVSTEGRQHELLAKRIMVEAERKGNLFTEISELERLGDKEKILSLVATYNSCIYPGHLSTREIRVYSGKYLYMTGYVNDTIEIIKKLQNSSKYCIKNYSSFIDSYLSKPDAAGIDIKDISADKLQVFRRLYDCTMVAVLNGAAGTGKTFLIRLLSDAFTGYKKIFLANTIPAKENMRRRVNISAEDKCLTVASFLAGNKYYDGYAFLIIDEGSTISNRDMCSILKSSSASVFLLVGDSFQLGAINFGNWFHLINEFLKNEAVNCLSTVHRTASNDMLRIWDAARQIRPDLAEFLARANCLSEFNQSLYNRNEEDEIILALNYNGLYGINNINAFLQENNPAPSVSLGITHYKVNDPILFSENKRFEQHLHNNLKGKIVGIQDMRDRVIFDVEVDKVILEFGLHNAAFELLSPIHHGKSVVRFSVLKRSDDTDDDGDSESYVVPFQIAYAISIHKAQGLEYESVKVVITDDVCSQISHDVFYTAITRAKSRLKIYSNVETMKKLVGAFQKRNYYRDVNLLKALMGAAVKK